MIARTLSSVEPAPWQAEFGAAVRSAGELLRLLGLPERAWPIPAAAAAFPVRVPRGYIARMRPKDPGDPLLLQVLPLTAEDRKVDGYGPDPVGDSEAEIIPGLLHKYAGRVLLIATGACAVHCRYCFRRHFHYAESHGGAQRWRPVLDYLETATDIREVILSGGDPLSMADGRLAPLAAALDGIPHLQRLRIHSRLPVVLPERVDAALGLWLASGRLQRVMVIHANHANELDGAVAAAMDRLRSAGVTLLNQSVLLRGVNDSAAALAALSEALFGAGVLPYYLHLLDPVQGAAHFEVPEAEAKLILNELRARLPGYLVPRLVREQTGAPYKLAL